MTDKTTTTGRTNPPGNEEASDSEEDYPNDSTTFSNSAPGDFRSRTLDYDNQSAFPSEPLYVLGEVVYIVVSGQTQPAGPYVITNIWEDNQYSLKRQDTGAELAHSVRESELVVLG